MLFSKFLSEDWSVIMKLVHTQIKILIFYVSLRILRKKICWILNSTLFDFWLLSDKIVIRKEIEDREKESSDENAGIKEEEK